MVPLVFFNVHPILDYAETVDEHSNWKNLNQSEIRAHLLWDKNIIINYKFTNFVEGKYITIIKIK